MAEIDLVPGVVWGIPETFGAPARIYPPRLDKYWDLDASASLTSELEGYRWRDDDDDEISAAWLEDQEVDITRQTGLNTRLRTLLDYAGNPPSQQVTLQYRKTGDPDSEWRAVP
jgi:hypothetical protein